MLFLSTKNKLVLPQARRRPCARWAIAHGLQNWRTPNYCQRFIADGSLEQQRSMSAGTREKWSKSGPLPIPFTPRHRRRRQYFVHLIDVNIDTVTASLVARRPTPIRTEVEVPSPVTAPSAAPSPACRAAMSPARRVTSCRRRLAMPRHRRGPPVVFRTRTSKFWRRPWVCAGVISVWLAPGQSAPLV